MLKDLDSLETAVNRLLEEFRKRKGDIPPSAESDPGGNDAPPANERMMWDALDTGIDPTDVDGVTPGDRPDTGHGAQWSTGDADDGSGNSDNRRSDRG